MKTLSIVAALLITAAAAPAAAQSAGTEPLFGARGGSNGGDPVAADSGPQTLMDARGLITHNGWYVAPTFGATYVNAGVSPIYGVRGAWRVNKKFGIGLAVNGFEFEDDGAEMDPDAGYGGLLLEYVINSDDLAHAVLATTIGGGAWCPSASERNDCEDAHGFFVAEPTFGLELNVASFMRAGLGGGYRIALAENRQGIGSSDLSGFVGRVSLEFGRF